MLALFQFDAVAVPVMERMVREGRLPTFAALQRRGVWRTIDTRASILQSATYPTLCTGMDVREHGLYSAFPWSAVEQRARFLHALERPRTIWDRLTAAGRRSLIVDPILSWPPGRMEGVYLNGWHFEDRMLTQARSVPADVRRTLAKRLGRPPKLDDVYGTRQESTLLAWHRHLVAAPGRAANAVCELVARQPFDLVWMNFSAAHKAGHQFWDVPSVVDAPLSVKGASALNGALQDVYAAVDEALGRTLEALPDNADVIVFSPLGMGPNTSRADLLPAMLNAVLGGTQTQVERSSPVRTPVWSLRSALPISWRARLASLLPDRLVADVTTRLYLRADWDHTLAMAVPGEHNGYIRLNLKGRERHGIVEPSDSDALLDSITEGLMTFRDLDGVPSVTRVTRRSEIAAEGARADRLPDLVIDWGARQAGRVTGVESPRFGSIARRGVGSGRSGNHQDDAWALLLPATSRIREIGRSVRITDIGATACSLLGSDMTGLTGTPLLDLPGHG